MEDQRDRFKPVLFGVLLGLLVATAPTWLFSPHAPSSYSAPWVYPGDMVH